MRWAVCVTTKGNLHLLEESLRSAWQHFPHDGPGSFIVVTADRPSSPEARLLRRLAKEWSPGMRLIERPGCRRGLGRQLAFEAAKEAGATHVIQSVDTDTVYHAPVRGMLELFLTGMDPAGIFLQGVCWNAASVSTMDELGGWPRHLQIMEDRVVWATAVTSGRFAYLLLDATEHVRARRRRNLLFRVARVLHYNVLKRRVERRWPGATTMAPASYPPPAQLGPDIEALRKGLAAYWQGRPRRHVV